MSWVTPRSSVMASNLLRPGDLRDVLRIAALAMLHDLGRALERAHLGYAGDVIRVGSELHAKFEVLVRIVAQRLFGELNHGSVSLGRLLAGDLLIWMITNSAGLSGAKPTTMFTMPLA